ncbi:MULTISPECIES: non-hydrolyzing UDP-N-acetylglucosamine 2-epimerase [Asticcacaulis]|uniref:non-hydrolyzing UDP-N-acetylglucosamine 2-epimerase n=1 Tax=Asticcacaulis TaxID=76890 RepID=UPI001AE82761|nr:MULTISPECIES: UDP-N-acetylglucosamine 2-epimerase (non-hydrolyzing) [Asticcacaulis]MBP2161884.1 UDP-N-acetylglucosamine 2-epimerase (non-hydrolyzing) [Asticcacaulis solisilvae]MDR6802931.1 UDP-N-acetylglucosamine 2-epimerase (non-hydrolyzing) [Asticcacaulis sp. BE141]
MSKKNVVVVVGTRPEAIKCAPIIRGLMAEEWANPVTVVTAQHRELLDKAFHDLGIKADVDLDLMRAGQSLSEITGRAFLALEPALKSLSPDVVLAQGDTTTVMAVATVCFYLGLPFGHVEAGLRTHDIVNPFPEEFNRVVAGRIASMHFAPTQGACDALLKEGVKPQDIYLTGNTGIDTLVASKARAVQPAVQLPDGGRLILLTSHRRENFGEPMRQAFQGVLDVLDTHADVQVLFPVHPNPRVVEMANAMFGDNPRIHLCAPLDYNQFVGALKAAHIVLTDSGGVQEEAPVFGKPVLVMRQETERPEAVYCGVSKLIGTRREDVFEACDDLLSNAASYAKMASGISPYGDGLAASRIIRVLADRLGVPSALPAYAPFEVKALS